MGKSSHKSINKHTKAIETSESGEASKASSHKIEYSLTNTTPEYWPINAKNILTEKGVNIADLREKFTKIYFPWDPIYNGKRVYFSLRIQQRPLFIVKPVCVCEIEEILNYVKLKNLSIRIMNGRHSSQLTYSQVLVDMSGFMCKKLKNNTLIAGAGNTQGALNDFLFNQKQVEHYSHFGSFIHPRVDTDAFPGGSAASVGSAGISTAGGIGTLCRTYALTIDSILAYKITVPPTEFKKARTITASRDKHSDLFWALRGGVGSNFGIISAIIYKIIIVPEIIQYSIVWPWSSAVSVLDLWKNQSLQRPNQFNEDIVVLYNPENKQQGIELGGIYVIPEGQTEEKAVEQIHAQVDSLGGVLTIKPKVPYSNLYTKLVQNRRYFNFSIIQPFFSNKIHAEEIVKIMDKAKLENQPGPISIGFTLLGGKITEAPLNSAAFYPREKDFFIDIASFWDNITQSESMQSWTNLAIKDVLRIEDTYAYVGFPITFSDIKYTNEVYFGKHYPRLQKIKERYDPLNILTQCGTISSP